MFANDITSRVTLRIDDFSQELLVWRATGEEAISQPYRFDIECVSERADIDLNRLLGKTAYLKLPGTDQGIHGVIYRAEFAEPGVRLSHYRLSLVPRLQLLAHRRNSRVFQHLRIPDIIATLLESHGILQGDYRFSELAVDYPEREYCVQYAESDLNFLQRICEEVGIHYHFQHTAENHVLVFGDDQTAFPLLPAPVSFHQGNGLVSDEPVIKRFSPIATIASSNVARRDYNFLQSSLTLEAEATTDLAPSLEDYDFPGHFDNRATGKRLSQRRLDLHRLQRDQATGDSDQPLLRSGYFLTLRDHPRSALNDLWLITSVSHTIVQNQALEELADATGDIDSQSYSNQFTVTPWAVPFRPPMKHPRPRVLVSQSAHVTGDSNDEICCDEFGRVKVVFPWSREGDLGARSSCWIRVASSWAGDRYGAVTIPRVGMEVLVSFYEGNPDNPVITACIPDSRHKPPYELPANRTRSVFRSHSSPGSTGYNELHIEDRAGQEQIYLHAERDLRQDIKNDSLLHIGNQRREIVEGNSLSQLNAEEHRIIQGDRKVHLCSNDHLWVSGDQHTRTNGVITVAAGQQIHLKAGAQLVIDAGSSISLHAGGHHILIGPGGIFSSTSIVLGGAPLPGLPATPLPPGELVAPPQPPEPPAAISVTQLGLMAASRRLQSDFCPICEACREGQCELGGAA